MKVYLSLMFAFVGISAFGQETIAPKMSVHLEAGFGLSFPTDHVVTVENRGSVTSTESTALNMAADLIFGLTYFIN